MNQLRAAPSRSRLQIVLHQFASLPVAVLLGSAVLSVTTGGVADAAVILSVVAINAALGTVTESRAERTTAALSTGRDPPAAVVRSGKRRVIPAAEVVPGDVLLLAPGDLVAADGRLVEVERLTVDEATLTGESLPVVKSLARLPAHAALRDRDNMVYRGTLVTGGSGSAIVVATGAASEAGRIQHLVGTVRPPETPVQRQLRQLGTTLGLATGAICVAVFGVGITRAIGVGEMLKTAACLAVAAVPEGLPMVATTTLALGVSRMRRLNVVVRRLEAIETLGAVQVFCLDKTGTLTMNRMRVESLLVGRERLRVEEDRIAWRPQPDRPPNGTAAMPGDDPSRPSRSEPPAAESLTCAAARDGRMGLLPDRVDVQNLLTAIVLCNEAEIDGSPSPDGLGRPLSGAPLSGSPTETALIRLAMAAGIDVPHLRALFQLVETQYRTEQRGYMRTVHRTKDDQRFVAVKGRPGEVLELCRWQCQPDGIQGELSAEDRGAIATENEKLAGQALRVLGVAYRLDTCSADVGSQPLIWLGLVGIADPIRPGVPDVIRQFHRAGVRTIMITGDQSATAQAIGRALALSGDRRLDMLDSAELDRIDPEVLKSLAQNVQVFSAVSPSHKLRIVQALQRAGVVVAMTGDGVNDGPALKAADIGVAMGGDAGAELARSTADVVLIDDNLATMIVAIGQGRSIYDNTRRAIAYLLATNMSEIVVMFVSLAAGTSTPLNPLQLLWINLVSDVFPVLALAVRPPAADVLSRPPRDPRDPLLTQRDLGSLGLQALMISAGTLGAYGYGIHRYGPGNRASTIAFTSLTAAQLLHLLAAGGSGPLPHRSAARLVVGAFWTGLGLQLLTLFVPPLRRLLRNTPLRPADWLACCMGAAAPYLVTTWLQSSLDPTASDPQSPRPALPRKGT